MKRTKFIVSLQVTFLIITLALSGGLAYKNSMPVPYAANPSTSSGLTLGNVEWVNTLMLAEQIFNTKSPNEQQKEQAAAAVMAAIAEDAKSFKDKGTKKLDIHPVEVSLGLGATSITVALAVDPQASAPKGFVKVDDLSKQLGMLVAIKEAETESKKASPTGTAEIGKFKFTLDKLPKALEDSRIFSQNSSVLAAAVRVGRPTRSANAVLLDSFKDDERLILGAVNISKDENIYVAVAKEPGTNRFVPMLAREINDKFELSAITNMSTEYVTMLEGIAGKEAPAVIELLKKQIGKASPTGQFLDTVKTVNLLRAHEGLQTLASKNDTTAAQLLKYYEDVIKMPGDTVIDIKTLMSLQEKGGYDKIILPIGLIEESADTNRLILVFTGEKGKVDNVVAIVSGGVEGIYDVRINKLGEFGEFVSERLKAIVKQFGQYKDRTFAVANYFQALKQQSLRLAPSRIVSLTKMNESQKILAAEKNPTATQLLEYYKSVLRYYTQIDREPADTYAAIDTLLSVQGGLDNGGNIILPVGIIEEGEKRLVFVFTGKENKVDGVTAIDVGANIGIYDVKIKRSDEFVELISGRLKELVKNMNHYEPIANRVDKYLSELKALKLSPTGTTVVIPVGEKGVSVSLDKITLTGAERHGISAVRQALAKHPNGISATTFKYLAKPFDSVLPIGSGPNDLRAAEVILKKKQQVLIVLNQPHEGLPEKFFALKASPTGTAYVQIGPADIKLLSEVSAAAEAISTLDWDYVGLQKKFDLVQPVGVVLANIPADKAGEERMKAVKAQTEAILYSEKLQPLSVEAGNIVTDEIEVVQDMGDGTEIEYLPISPTQAILMQQAKGTYVPVAADKIVEEAIKKIQAERRGMLFDIDALGFLHKRADGSVAFIPNDKAIRAISILNNINGLKTSDNKQRYYISVYSHKYSVEQMKEYLGALAVPFADSFINTPTVAEAINTIIQEQKIAPENIAVTLSEATANNPDIVGKLTENLAKAVKFVMVKTPAPGTNFASYKAMLITTLRLLEGTLSQPEIERLRHDIEIAPGIRPLDIEPESDRKEVEAISHMQAAIKA